MADNYRCLSSEQTLLARLMIARPNYIDILR